MIEEGDLRPVIEIPGALGGERVDRVVALLSGRTRAQVAKLIAAGGVRLGGAVVAAGSRRVRVGEILETDLRLVVGGNRSVPAPAEAGEVPFRVVFDDEAVIVVDKPPGVVVHPDGAHRSGTLVSGLLAMYPELARLPSSATARSTGLASCTGWTGTRPGCSSSPAPPTPIARSPLELAARTVRRTYLALACGALDAEAGVVDAPIGRSLRDPTRMAVAAGGRAARTHYRVLARFAEPLEATYLELRLETGRTHQIRVHLAAIGHPVVGDARYRGDRRRSGASRPFLHAAGLAFVDRATDQQAEFSSPLPDDLVSVLERFS